MDIHEAGHVNAGIKSFIANLLKGTPLDFSKGYLVQLKLPAKTQGVVIEFGNINVIIPEGFKG